MIVNQGQNEAKPTEGTRKVAIGSQSSREGIAPRTAPLAQRPNAVTIKGNHNFFTTSAPVFQEISLKEFAESEFSVMTFLSHLSRGKVNVFYQGGSYFIYTIIGENVRFLDVTGFVYAQMELTQLLFLWNACFILIVYVISLYFVKSSLRNLKKLARFAQDLNFEDLSTPLKIKGHKYDEIRLIAEAFNSSLEKINSQVQSLKEFIANASHELKTPLMMINTEIDIALKKQDYEDRLINIKGNIKRISALLETLSLITRLESEKNIEKKEVNLRETIQTILPEIEKHYTKKEIHRDIPKNMKVLAHQGLLEIVIKNLIENAYKYAGDNASISIISTKNTLSVSDTGKGIPPEFQQQIFERFRQLEKTEHENHSFGLGLYLVKKIVEIH